MSHTQDFYTIFIRLQHEGFDFDLLFSVENSFCMYLKLPQALWEFQVQDDLSCELTVYDTLKPAEQLTTSQFAYVSNPFFDSRALRENTFSTQNLLNDYHLLPSVFDHQYTLKLTEDMKAFQNKNLSLRAHLRGKYLESALLNLLNYETENKSTEHRSFFGVKQDPRFDINRIQILDQKNLVLEDFTQLLYKVGLVYDVIEVNTEKTRVCFAVPGGRWEAIFTGRHLTGYELFWSEWKIYENQDITPFIENTLPIEAKLSETNIVGFVNALKASGIPCYVGAYAEQTLVVYIHLQTQIWELEWVLTRPHPQNALERFFMRELSEKEARSQLKQTLKDWWSDEELG